MSDDRHRVTHFGTPFRIGSTSYVYPDDILPNVEKLAASGDVDDIELILFEVDDGPNNIPSEALISQIDTLARQANISYTVHLPLDLTLAADGSAQHESLVKARGVIERTLPLDPFAFVFHLDGKGLQTPGWVDRSLRALDMVMGWVPDPALLAVENLENYPSNYLNPVLARAPISRTTDIGHLWKMELDPMDYLPAWLPRTRVIHIHGMAERDHHSLALMPPEKLDPVVRYLLEAQYSGVMTLEVFETMDFFTSQAALMASLNREAHSESYIPFQDTLAKRTNHDLITLALSTTDEEIMWPPIASLQGRSDRQTFEDAATLARSKTSHERVVGTSILAQTGWKENRPFLEETLSILLNILEIEQDLTVIDSTLAALTHISDPRKLEPILKWKDHPFWSIRFHVTNGLASSIDERSIQAQIKFSRDEDETVRDWACMWLGSLVEQGIVREDIRNALWERIETDDQDGGYGEAMNGLAAMGDHRVTPHILKWLASGNAGWLSFDAAGNSDDPEIYKAMLELREQWKDNPAIPEFQHTYLDESIQSCLANIEGRNVDPKI